jgi:putative sterol carrier protein
MPQISSAAEAFEQMAGSFDSAKAAGVNATIQMELTGDGGGVWAVDIADGALEVVDGGVDSPTTTLIMSADDFVGLVNGEVNAMAAFMQGKIKLQGDMGLAMKFQSIFGIA